MAKQEYLNLGQAAARVRMLTGRKPASASIWRWARQGLVSRSGARVKLRHGRVGRSIVTTEAWLRSFFQKLADKDASAFDEKNGNGQPKRRRERVRLRSDTERKQQADRAERELRAAGWS